METFVVRILRPVGDVGDDGDGNDDGPRLRGVVRHVSRGHEEQFSSGDELIEVLRDATFDGSESP